MLTADCEQAIRNPQIGSRVNPSRQSITQVTDLCPDTVTVRQQLEAPAAVTLIRVPGFPPAAAAPLPCHVPQSSHPAGAVPARNALRPYAHRLTMISLQADIYRIRAR